MHLPRPIYDSIPVIYIVGGLISLLLIEMPFSVVSACLFVCASWMVWRMRKHHRNRYSSRDAGTYDKKSD